MEHRVMPRPGPGWNLVQCSPQCVMAHLDLVTRENLGGLGTTGVLIPPHLHTARGFEGAAKFYAEIPGNVTLSFVLLGTKGEVSTAWRGKQRQKEQGEGWASQPKCANPYYAATGSILRRWKRNWFALWLGGTLGYYHDETAQDEEDRVLIHFNVRDIKIGKECQDVQPPEGRSRDGLLTVNLREGSRLHLCAETQDDAIAWKTALLEANSTPVRVYSPYQDYYEVVPPNAHEATYVRSYYGPPYAGPGVTHVIVREDPCYSSGAPLAMGMLAGAATGAALGSLMWSPCWF
ncbi:Pleckstrin homology domain-containing family B member 1 [Tupaia chinensis]|uniref:Pleckstrin homology domain-containing family B member 1 n=1 Tax=Tupaia chinensis TaxID=246437 RepID=L9LB11_TUPCH|nr:Pleckstrin homology domain-containing family B member 1 [Tupaia chinensis]